MMQSPPFGFNEDLLAAQMKDSIQEHRAAFMYQPKREPRRAKSALSQRVDSKGVLRWFHATKGWRDPVK
jgi:hypothetical protein